MERAVRTSSLASSHRPIKKGGYKTFTDHTALSAIFRAMRLAICYRCSSSTKRCRMFLALRKTSAGGKFDTLKDALTCLVGLLAPTISYQSSAISDRRIGYPCDGHAQKAEQNASRQENQGHSFVRSSVRSKGHIIDRKRITHVGER